MTTREVIVKQLHEIDSLLNPKFHHYILAALNHVHHVTDLEINEGNAGKDVEMIRAELFNSLYEAIMRDAEDATIDRVRFWQRPEAGYIQFEAIFGQQRYSGRILDVAWPIVALAEPAFSLSPARQALIENFVQDEFKKHLTTNGVAASE